MVTFDNWCENHALALLLSNKNIGNVEQIIWHQENEDMLAFREQTLAIFECR